MKIPTEQSENMLVIGSGQVLFVLSGTGTNCEELLEESSAFQKYLKLWLEYESIRGTFPVKN